MRADFRSALKHTQRYVRNQHVAPKFCDAGEPDDEQPGFDR
jgi:hypothetical protein